MANENCLPDDEPVIAPREAYRLAPPPCPECERLKKERDAALAERDEARKWTRERPTRPGWYWLRAADFGHVRLVVNEIVRVHEELGPAYIVGFGWGRRMEDMPQHAEWSGPIQEPEVQHG